jgi:5-methylcytosine-specific restriction endonuclease McrA
VIIQRFKPTAAGTKLESERARMVRQHRNDGRHQSIVGQYRRQYPLCLPCLLAKKLTPTQEVHHIHRVSEGGVTEASNLLACCRSCHKAVDKLPRQEQQSIKQQGETTYNKG